LNGAIRAPQLRVIDSDGKQLGIMGRSEALRLADECRPTSSKDCRLGQVQLPENEATTGQQTEHQIA